MGSCCIRTQKLFQGIDACYDCDSNVAKEKGKRFELMLKDDKLSFCKIKYDGCLFVEDQGERCDYLFSICQETGGDTKLSKVIFVELKGKDVCKALDQISATINRTIKQNNYITIQAYVVSSRSPKRADSRVNKKIEQFYKAHKFKPTIKNSQFTLSI